ncbi:MAG: PDZ domain-containing protein [Pyrinomonadaceae bacterium]
MSKRSAVIAITVLVCATLVGGTLGRHTRPFTPAPKTASGAMSSIEEDYEEALQVVTANYAGEVKHEKASQAAIQSMLWSLDPHSTFFPPDEFRKLREDQDSRFYGIGVSIRRYKGGVYVTSLVAEDAPAARKGLRPGDLILEVEGQDASEWGSERVSREVRGDRGKPVTIKVQRAGAEAPIYFTVVRDAVPLPSIPIYFMVRPGTGYIGLTRGFQHTTDDELRRAIRAAAHAGHAATYFRSARQSGRPSGSSDRRQQRISAARPGYCFRAGARGKKKLSSTNPPASILKSFPWLF